MTTRERHIVAMGGGGFSDEPDNPRLDDFILDLTGKRRPRVCFIGTASGDDPGYAAGFEEAFGGRGLPTSVLRLFYPQGQPPAEEVIREADLVYVGGGSTVNLLAIWRAHGIGELLRAAWQSGTLLCGLSAGSMCWFEAGPTDSRSGGMSYFDNGLGLLPGSHCAHYQDRSISGAYEQFVTDGVLPDGVGADDGVGLHYVGAELHRVVASRSDARAYSVRRASGGVNVIPIEAEILR